MISASANDIYLSPQERAFSHIVRAKQIDLQAAVLQIAATENPSFHLQRCQQQLDHLAAMAQQSLVSIDCTNTAGAAQALCDFFTGQGFEGNRQDYYAAANSRIDVVLETGKGIPISLAFCYLHVARSSLHWPLQAVGFPGHFLLRLQGSSALNGANLAGEKQASASIYIDPFDAKVMTRQQCKHLFYSAQGLSLDASEASANSAQGSMPWRDDFLASVSDEAILWRMLGNLKNVHLRQHHEANALRVLNLQLLLRPHAYLVRLERAWLLEELDCLAAAIVDIETVLAVHDDTVANTLVGDTSAHSRLPDDDMLQKLQRKLAQLRSRLPDIPSRPFH